MDKLRDICVPPFVPLTCQHLNPRLAVARVNQSSVVLAASCSVNQPQKPIRSLCELHLKCMPLIDWQHGCAVIAIDDGQAKVQNLRSRNGVVL